MLKPVEGEEWIEKKRAREFWITEPRGYPQKFYSRLTRGYVGWWTYLRLHSIWHRASLLVDPLSSGGLYSHLRCFLYNWVVVDLIWGIKHSIWKFFHREEWERQCALMAAIFSLGLEEFGNSMHPDTLIPSLPQVSPEIFAYADHLMELPQEWTGVPAEQTADTLAQSPESSSTAPETDTGAENRNLRGWPPEDPSIS